MLCFTLCLWRIAAMVTDDRGSILPGSLLGLPKHRATPKRPQILNGVVCRDPKLLSANDALLYDRRQNLNLIVDCSSAPERAPTLVHLKSICRGGRTAHA